MSVTPHPSPSNTAEATRVTEKLNKWLTLIANIAVVISIVFLALERNQNSLMMKTQTRNAIAESIMNFQFNSVTSGLQALAMKGNADPASLTPQEAQLVAQFYVSNLRLWENIHYQYRNGVFDREEFEAEIHSWKTLGDRMPLLHVMYCGLKGAQGLSPEFVKEMDSLGFGSAEKCAAPTGILVPGVATQQ